MICEFSDKVPINRFYLGKATSVAVDGQKERGSVTYVKTHAIHWPRLTNSTVVTHVITHVVHWQSRLRHSGSLMFQIWAMTSSANGYGIA